MSFYHGDEKRAPEQWHFTREISIPDLVSFSAALAAVITAYATLDKRVSILEVEQIRQSVIDKTQDTERVTIKVDVNDRLTKIETKLDRLIERK